MGQGIIFTASLYNSASISEGGVESFSEDNVQTDSDGGSLFLQTVSDAPRSLSSSLLEHND